MSRKNIPVALSSELDPFPRGEWLISRTVALPATAPAEYAYVVRALCNIGPPTRQSTG